MIIGVIVVIVLLVIRLQMPRLDLAQDIALPEGATMLSYTQTQDWYAVVTDQNQILIFDLQSGALRQTIEVNPTPVAAQ